MCRFSPVLQSIISLCQMLWKLTIMSQLSLSLEQYIKCPGDCTVVIRRCTAHHEPRRELLSTLVGSSRSRSLSDQELGDRALATLARGKPLFADLFVVQGLFFQRCRPAQQLVLFVWCVFGFVCWQGTRNERQSTFKYISCSGSRRVDWNEEEEEV